ncbi:MAG: bifunctional proline dehydrogenase/L-glutamate gamma-semialdehyde dehydrogenase PutA, partial [Devosia nanyangense]|nr:bifunctional proline dehydrogenase/L-glutamate gamma-semialdehyde dehydrogenase PutA [Devosia nanyangense]
PVYTRKVYTDVSYLACAKKLLGAPDAIFPQFATHNAQTLATIYQMAGPDFEIGRYEFQCLHGMGEPLYEEVVGKDKLDRPCRIYAPVGSHETLLAYLVRRLLENGANSSFVNQIADPDYPIDELIGDPVAKAAAIFPVGSMHSRLKLPRDILGARKNSAGLNLSNENDLQTIEKAFGRIRTATGNGLPVTNPADRSDVVGHVTYAEPGEIEAAFAATAKGGPAWAALGAEKRAAILRRAGDIMEERLPDLLGIVIREAGKSTQNAIAEVREAIDFLRYYADEARDDAAPLGTVVCISPWNVPLAIFTGQVTAALAAGNAVVCKPAEETPLIATEGVRILHEAGVPADVLRLVIGDGPVGAALVGHKDTHGVVFTGSVEVAQLIQKQLAEKQLPDGRPVPLIAETGGQNAMIVDSSALPEQVVADVLTSAFDSAGQRCSALRILCLQDDIADHTLKMIKGGLDELALANPQFLATDIGPVITEEARDRINGHIEAMKGKGHAVSQLPLHADAGKGTFVAPTIIELNSVSELAGEVFGPVLHVVRFKRAGLHKLIDEINALGYGLTFGLHTRIDETIQDVTSRIEVGNVYINRNIIGAVVGVQPFGGHGLSGTGPKAGGPLYMRRMVLDAPVLKGGKPGKEIEAYRHWLVAEGRADVAGIVANYAATNLNGAPEFLAGPVGEENSYGTKPRGTIALVPATEEGLLIQLGAVLATGNKARVVGGGDVAKVLDKLPTILGTFVSAGTDLKGTVGVLVEGDAEKIRQVSREAATLEGPVVLVQGASTRGLAEGTQVYNLDLLVLEVSTSINTAAAGGNASLMTIG